MENENVRVELGDLVRDRITGFTGVVECISEWLNSCRRVSVKPQTLKDGRPVDNYVFDEPQLEIVEAGYFNKPVIEKGKKTGGPALTPVRRTDPV